MHSPVFPSQRELPDVMETLSASEFSELDYPTFNEAIPSLLAPNECVRLARLHNVWEQNLQSVYNYCSTHFLEWPTLTIDWIPDRKFEDPDRDYVLQYLAVGTQAIEGEKNYVRVLEVAIPIEESEELTYYADTNNETSSGETPTTNIINSPLPPAELVSEEVKEGTFDPGMRFKNLKGHCIIDQMLNINDPVLKIRAMPQNSNIIAVKTTRGFIGLYNLNKHKNIYTNNPEETIPDEVLRGHKTGGFALSWNPVKNGFIASGSDDGYMNYWDISHQLSSFEDVKKSHNDRGIQPIRRLEAHTDAVTDVCWHGSQAHLILSAGMDGEMHLWDMRSHRKGLTWPHAHSGGVTAAQLHPTAVFQLASAGVDGIVRLWDIRRDKKIELASLQYHGKSIHGMQWAPFSETVLSTFGTDGRVVVWDVARRFLTSTSTKTKNTTINNNDKEEFAPPEVSFVHIGHIGRVTDASWCNGKDDQWLMASADTMNGLHVYSPSKHAILDYIPS